MHVPWAALPHPRAREASVSRPDCRWAGRPLVPRISGLRESCWPVGECQKTANDASQSAGAAKGLKLSR